MNRIEKRNQIKIIQKKLGISREEATDLLIKWSTPLVHLLENTKVYLNYNAIKIHPDWDILNPLYKKFVEHNKGKLFTVEYDTFKKKNDTSDKDTFVCLREDETDPKWLFHTFDLTIAEQQDELKEESLES